MEDGKCVNIEDEDPPSLRNYGEAGEEESGKREHTGKTRLRPEATARQAHLRPEAPAAVSLWRGKSAWRVPVPLRGYHFSQNEPNFFKQSSGCNRLQTRILQRWRSAKVSVFFTQNEPIFWGKAKG